MHYPIASFAAALMFGYFVGSVPFGLLLTRMAGLGDVRKIGSGNIGATNVLRTGNKGLAGATLLLDGLKGTIAVLIAGRFGTEAGLVAGFGAFMGHCFPVWLQFKGGKGVATFLGILAAITWKIALGFAVLWLCVAIVTRYSSLAALVATAASPFALWLAGDMPSAMLLAVIAAVCWYNHRQNIARLQAGTESRIGAKS